MASLIFVYGFLFLTEYEEGVNLPVTIKKFISAIMIFNTNFNSTHLIDDNDDDDGDMPLDMQSLWSVYFIFL